MNILTFDELNRGFSPQDAVLPKYPHYDFSTRKRVEERQRKFRDFNRWFNDATRLAGGSLKSEIFRDMNNAELPAAEALKKYACNDMEELHAQVLRLMNVDIFKKHPEWKTYDAELKTNTTKLGETIKQIRQLYSEGIAPCRIVELTGASETLVAEIITTTFNAIVFDEDGNILSK